VGFAQVHVGHQQALAVHQIGGALGQQLHPRWAQLDER
jgi:hypothetical protein